MQSKGLSSDAASKLIQRFVERSGVHKPGQTAEQVITAILEQRRGRNDVAPDEHVQKLLGQRNIRSVELVVDLDCDGILEPLGTTFAEGFRMRLNKKVPDARRRFTLAHELCHTFFYELVPELKFQSHQTDELEERLCNIGASVLLVPSIALQQKSREFSVSLDSLQHLAKTFGVSVITMFLRLRSLNLWKCEFSAWHRMADGTFQLEKMYGGRRVPWQWHEPQVLEEGYASAVSLFGRGFVHYEDEGEVRRYKPVMYNVKRSPTGVMALWGKGIVAPSHAFPLFSKKR